MLTALLLVFLVGLVMSVPIALTMLLATLIPGWISSSFAADTAFIVRGIIGGADSTPIIAVPLFMLSGIVMARGGISEKLFNVFAYLFGKMRAGLPCTVIITCLFYGAISGSGPATCAAVGTMGIPVLLKMGYDRVFCGAIIGTAGGLGVIIPPSIPFILFGIATGASVGNLFLGGILPGILIALCLCGYAIFYCTRHGEDKNAINAYVGGLRARGFGKVFLESFWALLTPVIILGGIYSGAVTPTEAACISVFYSLIVAFFIYRTIRIRDLWPILTESIRSYAPLCLMLTLATVLGRVLTLLQLPNTISQFITAHFNNRYLFLLVLVLILLVLGMFMDCAPAIMILGPMLLPVAKALGINEIHLGVIMVVDLAVGFITPPFGVNLFVASRLIDVPVLTLGKRVIPFIITFLAALLLITYIPALSLMFL
ncbi:TRAP transporter large permease subunit [Cuneatibacter sp. NSJ-177]|uniref:TRAP transporter large permease n=1 Tax=Cuneatibacter sp. NSJ-177 TaxID=2931401 RepID=UPI001FD031FD|nr:TRAP transporter large permease subunit [Cuneatibacter sp. NSJ-177]MCJ7834191.1 TRAP transporter large permease subunit [Cuneatibacter sp. NSJ-177]